jgi:hypothetical protein
MKSPTTRLRWFGLKRSAFRQLAHLASVFLLAALLVGCGKHGADATMTAASTDPEMNARLAELTHELHRTMIGRKLNRDFDEFVALRKLDVPPPPSDKKYAISEKWRVVLQDK